MAQNPPKPNQNTNTDSNQTNQNTNRDTNQINQNLNEYSSQSSQVNQAALTPPERVIATQEALALISRLMQENQDKDKAKSQIIFIQSGGCCEGSVPICTLRSDFALGEADILIGNIGGADFYLHQSMLEYYKSTQLIIDAKEGFGSEYSLEYGSGWKFELSLRLFCDEEIALLEG